MSLLLVQSRLFVCSTNLFYILVEDRTEYLLDAVFTLIAWISVSMVATVWTRSSEVAGGLPLGDESRDAAVVVWLGCSWE